MKMDSLAASNPSLEQPVSVQAFVKRDVLTRFGAAPFVHGVQRVSKLLVVVRAKLRR